MAKSMTKTTTSSTVDSNTISEEAVKETPTKAVEKRTFKDTDPIQCMSITAGELGMIGLKTGINYRWFGRGEVIEIEYQDLVAAIRSGKKHITEPYFVIQDKDFLKQFPQVEQKYESMYSIKDLKDVLSLPPAQMKKVILSLPEGAQDSIKSIASTEISKGTLDSVQRIKTLDEIFDTKFLLMTELFNN